MSGGGRKREQTTTTTSVAVLYYLTRNGQLQHPHFMDVPLSSPNAPLFLSDVINRLNVLRGKGIASMYSWSCKRSYKNGYVWHDLSEKDLIYPAHDHEYVLKGSELPQNPIPGGGVHSITAEVSTQTDNKTPPESLGTLMKANGRDDQQIQKWRRRSSSVLMQLVSCGSLSLMGLRMSGKGKDYFSGSSVVDTTNKHDFPALQRSTSYNGRGDRKAYMEVSEKGIDERVKADCKPIKATRQSST